MNTQSGLDNVKELHDALKIEVKEDPSLFLFSFDLEAVHTLWQSQHIILETQVQHLQFYYV